MLVARTESAAFRADHNLPRIFMDLSKYIAELGAAQGFSIVPFRDSALPFFSVKNQLDQQRILNNLQTYKRICELTLSEGGKLNDPISISWAAIKQLGLRPTSDLFSFIGQDSVVEIHDSIGIQIFRNFNFYTYCSYSLEELYCFPWNHLYSRNDKVLHDLLVLVGKCYTGEIKNTIPTHLPAHVIAENYSPFNYQIQAEVSHISPLYDDCNRPVATVVIEKGSLVGRPLTPSEEEGRLNEYMKKGHMSPLDMN